MQNPYAYDEIAADAAQLCALAARTGLPTATVLAGISDDAARFVAERALTGGHIAVNPASAAALKRALTALAPATLA